VELRREKLLIPPQDKGEISQEFGRCWVLPATNKAQNFNRLFLCTYPDKCPHTAPLLTTCLLGSLFLTLNSMGAGVSLLWCFGARGNNARKGEGYTE
jgi:hypothetical protein